ncbi:MAG: hypothetical protein KFKLKKLM_01360 [Flavobacteriales bacterium]|nr:hypothetical protein [Flavobacteriales bacterium]
MKYTVYILFIGAVLSCSSTSVLNKQETQPEYILWDGKYKLVWEDFKGEVDSQYDEYDAVTWVLIDQRQKGLLEDKILYEVVTYFVINDSWVKKDKMNKELLQHEQLHWDISELYARKFRKMCSEHISHNLNSTFKYFNQEYDKMLLEESAFQTKYDTETNYSKNKEKQKEWVKKVKALLKKYEAYADTYLEIKRVKIGKQ